LHGEHLPGAHDDILVALSVVIAIIASFTALDLAGRVRASAGRVRAAWLAAAAVAMGGGIWAMHFIAMLAFVLPVDVAYAPGLTALSLALPIAVTGFGFVLVGGAGTIRPARLALAGLVMGGGIAAMHYTGMAAIRMPADLSHDALLVAVSVLIAIGAATVALWLAFRGTTLPVQAAGAVCMGLAIAAMHFTAMQAAAFAPRAAVDGAAGTASFDQAGLALGVAAVTFLILFLALAASLMDRRLASLSEREAVALRRSEEEFRTLYRSTPLPLHALDADGRVVHVSDAWLELLGRRWEEVIGRPLLDFMEPACAARRISEHWPRLLREGALHDEDCGFLAADGRQVTVLLSARVQRDGAGRFLRTLEGMVDITAHRRAEEALRHAAKMEAVGQLTGGVAHDFNNLLTAILGSLTLLERHVGAEERPRRLLETARSAVRRGADLSGRLLAFSRKQALRTEPVDANELLRETVPLIRRAIGEAIALEVELAAGLPPCRADASQLQAAVLNLAINARDAMPTGGRLLLGTALRPLGAEALRDNTDAEPGRFVAIAVEDTGHGMPPAVLARAFEPFFTTKEAGKGTGLGLSQVYGFVRQLGGHATIESSPGRGTAVTLFLPLAGAAAGAASGRPEAPAAAPEPGGRVLVVDDDAEVLATTAEMLREAGWNVSTAGDGRAALAELDRSAGTLRAMLSDVMMPGGMTGLDLAIEARRRLPGLGVLLTSGYPGALRQALPPGTEMLPKPFEREELLARLARLAAGAPPVNARPAPPSAAHPPAAR
jgi:PAS domain S-box-containing protein